MTRCVGWVTVLSVGLLLPSIAASADLVESKSDPSKRPAVRKVGVLDLNRLFKSHADLKGKLQRLQVEAKLVQAKLESDSAAVNKKAEGLKDLTTGTPEYRALDAEIAKRQATLPAEIATKRKEFVEREARLYYDAYQEIMKDVEKLAKSQHIAIVLNASHQEINAGDPNDVARGISNKVIWFDDSIDLTPVLEKNYSQCPAPAAAGKEASVAAESEKRSKQTGQAGVPSFVPHTGYGLPSVSTDW